MQCLSDVGCIFDFPFWIPIVDGNQPLGDGGKGPNPPRKEIDPKKNPNNNPPLYGPPLPPDYDPLTPLEPQPPPVPPNPSGTDPGNENDGEVTEGENNFSGYGGTISGGYIVGGEGDILWIRDAEGNEHLVLTGELGWYWPAGAQGELSYIKGTYKESIKDLEKPGITFGLDLWYVGVQYGRSLKYYEESKTWGFSDDYSYWQFNAGPGAGLGVSINSPFTKVDPNIPVPKAPPIIVPM